MTAYGWFFGCPASSSTRGYRFCWMDERVKSFAFRPAFDQMRGPGATIRRMLDFLFVALERSDSLLANVIATRTFEDNLALCLLLGLPQRHTNRFFKQKGSA